MAQRLFRGSTNKLLHASFSALLALTVVVAALGYLHSEPLLVAGAALLALAAGIAIAVISTRQVMLTESDLAREKELAQVTLHSIGDGVITTDVTGQVDYMNPVAEHYTGWGASVARGRALAEVCHIVDEQTGQRVNLVLRGEGGSADAPAQETDGAALRLVGVGGRDFSIRYSRRPIRGRDGALIGSVVVLHDVSQIRSMAQQLLWQASHDALTGLVNRIEFERRLQALIETARTQDREHALMFMDLDNFKAVNDSCGHLAGDELLRQLTTVMMTCMRGSDTLARLGGDEFGALLESCPEDQALRIANATRETVREFRFVWEDKTFSVGVSIGLVPINGSSGDLGQVLSLGDACCYQAKSMGRDRVQAYRPQAAEHFERDSELKVVSQINRAFETGGFQLYRQMIAPVAAAGGSPGHYEILVRMLDASGEIVPPSVFMHAAERYNLLTSLERWVISTLVEHLYRQWKAGVIPHDLGPRGERGFYSVNLSGASINDKSFPDFLHNLLTRYELPPGLLCFEITETTAISNLNKAAELMHDLKGMGCRFALDDFGTGMSSFAYLKYLPVDYLKIAGMFIEDMANDAMDHAIVNAINQISHILGMHTVAESVENAATLEMIRTLGIDYVQGYFVAKPEALLDQSADGLSQAAQATARRAAAEAAALARSSLG